MTLSSSSLLVLSSLRILRSPCSLRQLSMLFMHDLSFMQCVFHISASLLLINSTENKIHLLQGPALGFFEEYNDEGSHGKAEDSKHEESLPAYLVDSTRGNLSDDEVEQPLRGGTKTDTVGAKTSWENLSEPRLLVKCYEKGNILERIAHLAKIHPRDWSPGC